MVPKSELFLLVGCGVDLLCCSTDLSSTLRLLLCVGRAGGINVLRESMSVFRALEGLLTEVQKRASLIVEPYHNELSLSIASWNIYMTDVSGYGIQ